MSKAVAIPYIIALIIGLIVLGVLAYWFLITQIKGTGATDEAYCRGRLIQYCSDLATGKTPGEFEAYSKECALYIGKPGWPTKAPTSAEECRTQGILGI